ncbi:MAG: hypothetical protein OEW75_01615 [Cyclobacteriaceae bacterium]|nr:hypothetical protein [Cyclobacteriaceae bacterium]
MKKNILLSFLIAFTGATISAQINDQRERIYLHINNSVLISGETIVFGAYVLSNLTGKISKTSDVVYVELINQKESVYRGKVEITNGLGSGKIFIPSVLNTGRYYLIAYTRWMKNFNDYTAYPINIYNPFESLKKDSVKNSKPLISFYSTSGKMVANQLNKVGFEIKYSGEVKRQFKGRIQDDSGETIAELFPNKENSGLFYFTPSQNNYQIILEEIGGDFFFYNLPKIYSEGLTMNILEKSDAFTIELISSKDTDEGSITVSNSEGNYLQQQVLLSSSTLLSKNELQVGLNKVAVLGNNKDTLAQKMIFIPEKSFFNIVQITGNKVPRSKLQANTMLPAGKYSISVRKKFQTFNSPLFHSDFSRLNKSPEYHTMAIGDYRQDELDVFLMNPNTLLNYSTSKEVEFLPEKGTELLSGKITDNNNNAIANEIMTMTIPGSEFQFHTSKTDDLGRFTFLFNSPDVDTKIYIGSQKARDDIHFTIEDKWKINLPDLKFPTLNADSIQILEIVERSIQVQLLNAYEESKTDSTWYNPIEEFAPYKFFFNLDDYNRFPTLKDHIVEYIPTVGIRKDIINFLLPFATKSERYPHLLLLDGVPVSDEKILEFNPYKLKTIGVINNRYFLGPLIADGVLSMTTFDGNMSDFNPGNSVYSLTLDKINKPFEIEYPVYPNPSFKNMPDKRVQLFWKGPFHLIEEKNISVEFYTSDLTGKFEIVIEGFTDEGIPISSKTEFEVNK